VRVDAHVHTNFSGNASIHPLKYLLRESYNSPEGSTGAQRPAGWISWPTGARTPSPPAINQLFLRYNFKPELQWPDED